MHCRHRHHRSYFPYFGYARPYGSYGGGGPVYLILDFSPVTEIANVTNIASGSIGGNGVQNFTQATAINF